MHVAEARPRGVRILVAGQSRVPGRKRAIAANARLAGLALVLIVPSVRPAQAADLKFVTQERERRRELGA